MKITYESFYELSEVFRDGYGIAHAKSDHTPDECLPWQKGAIEFAEWLDEMGYKVTTRGGK